MACSNCNTPNCGCSGTYVVSQTCPPACSEVFNTACIVYTGVDITCPDNTTGITSTVVSRNDYLDTALTKIINYFCGRFNSLVIPTTVVQSDDPGIVVVEQTLGSVTTYLLSLDPAALPSASEVTGGVNVTVSGNGTPTTDPYVVNAQGSIVAVAPGTALSVIADADTPGPFDTTYTIDIDYDLLPDTILETSEGYITIAESPNVPNAGDMTYTLDVDLLTVETSDDRLAVALTSPGGSANSFLRTFDVTVDDAAMATWIMNSVVWNTDPLTDTGLIAGAGIAFAFDPVLSQIEISSAFVDPDRWDELSDFAGTTIQPSLPTSTLAFLANPATVDAGGDGISAVLGGIPSAAEVQFTNTDPGSAQLTFVDVTCSNVSGTPGGTASATVNGDVLTLVGGTDIDLTVLGNQITIDNLIDRVYSEIQSDAGDTLQAPNTTSTFTIAGGTGIGTIGDLASQTITINNEALVYDTITGDTGSTTASGLNDSLAIVSSGAGCSTTVTADTITIENTGVTSLAAVAGEGISVSGPTGAVTVANTGAQFANADIQISGGAVVGTGLIDVTSQGISSAYMSVQIVSQSSSILIPLTATNLIIDQMGIGVGTFRITNGTLADGDYTLMITGQF